MSRIEEPDDACPVGVEAEAPKRQIHAFVESVEEWTRSRRVRRETEGAEADRVPRCRRVIDRRRWSRRNHESNTDLPHGGRQLSWFSHGNIHR